jgi:hypothetical protein
MYTGASGLNNTAAVTKRKAAGGTRDFHEIQATRQDDRNTTQRRNVKYP